MPSSFAGIIVVMAYYVMTAMIVLIWNAGTQAPIVLSREPTTAISPIATRSVLR